MSEPSPTDRAEPTSASETSAPTTHRARLTTIFGWVAGGSLGLLVNYVLFLGFGEAYPVAPTTFVTFLAGAFGGMALADRLGERGFRPLGIAAGILLAAFAWVVAAGLLSNA